MPGQRSRRNLCCRLEFSERNGAIRQGAKYLDSSRMRKAVASFENPLRIGCGLRRKTRRSAFDDSSAAPSLVTVDGRYSTQRPTRRQVSNPRASKARKLLTGSRHRQAHALGDSGHGLVWLPDQESQCLQGVCG